MLLSTLRKAKEKGIKTIYVHGRKANEGELIKRDGKLLVFEDTGESHMAEDLVPIIFSTAIAKDDQRVYRTRNAEALVMGGYVIFAHTEESDAAVYKLHPISNTLTYCRYPAASVFGLDDASPIALEHGNTYTIDDHNLWEDFITAMVATGLITPDIAKSTQKEIISNT
jgi:hypothetical protein